VSVSAALSWDHGGSVLCGSLLARADDMPQIRIFPHAMSAFTRVQRTDPGPYAAGVHGYPRLVASPSSTPTRMNAEMPIRVVLADDQALMRRSLRLLLERVGNIEVIAEAGDLSSVEHHVHGHEPHVLVLDLSMPGGSSVEMIGRLRNRVPETQIVVLTRDESPVFAQQALAAGVLGYVLKALADAELPAAVRAAARGEQYISPSVSAGLDALQRSLTEERLTAREVEVLRLIALGHTSAEIAHKLQLSSRTVETHRRRIHNKLGLRTRADLVRYALASGLLRT
jgi:two-component system, NarL family, response regulator NreC